MAEISQGMLKQALTLDLEDDAGAACGSLMINQDVHLECESLSDD